MVISAVNRYLKSTFQVDGAYVLICSSLWQFGTDYDFFGRLIDSIYQKRHCNQRPQRASSTSHTAPLIRSLLWTIYSWRRRRWRRRRYAIDNRRIVTRPCWFNLEPLYLPWLEFISALPWRFQRCHTAANQLIQIECLSFISYWIRSLNSLGICLIVVSLR